MPYCPECGIHYLQPNSTCVSCGRDLREIVNSQDLADETFEKTTPPDLPLDESFIEFNGFQTQVETHLGKGLIKPHSVEVGVDGVHFKYDQPPHKLVKAEALKDKVVEFRVTAPIDPQEQFLEKTIAPDQLPGRVIGETAAAPDQLPGRVIGETAAPEVFPKGPLKEESSLPEFETRIYKEGPASGPPLAGLSKAKEPGESAKRDESEYMGAQVVEQVNWIGPEIGVETETKNPLEIELVRESENTETLNQPLSHDEGPGVTLEEPAPKPPEPELKGLDEPETLWEGKGSWFGSGARTHYRITNQSVVIVEPYNYRFTEFELALISKVKINQTWLMKLLGIGDVSMTVRGMPDPGLTLKGIREPAKVKRLIEELINR
ncbi:MAG: PH domain-containing protein [Firmicutes bacterium]|nr:PH domain-containing protein [Bacillota bacterium]